MKKLLLVMLVPVLVLGVMSCVEGVTDTEVDAYIQNAWSSSATPAVLPAIGTADGDIKLIISANQMTVKTGTYTSKPFRIQFAYLNTDSKARWVSSAGASAAEWAMTDDPSADTIAALLSQVKGLNELTASASAYKSEAYVKSALEKFFDESVLAAASLTWSAAGTAAFDDDTVDGVAALFDDIFSGENSTRGLVGELTAFGWEDGVEIAKLTVWYAETGTAGEETLSILNIVPTTPAWYKYDLPPVGKFGIMVVKE